jgi:anti-sigma B factor antagonist
MIVLEGTQVIRDAKDGQVRYEEIVERGRLHIHSQRDGDIHAIELRGEFDLAYAREVEHELKRAEASDARSIILDLSGLRFLDSTGIRLILEAQMRSQQDANRLVLLRAPRMVQRVFTIAGVEQMLPFAD